MSKPGQSPPSPSSSEPPAKLFRTDAPFGARFLPPPPPPSSQRPSIASTSSHRPSVASSSDASAISSSSVHRPHSISSADSGYYTSQSIQTIENAKPRSQSYPTNLSHVTTKLYTVNRPSIDHPKQVIELSEEQKQLPPSQPIARSACVPCRKKKVGCDLRQQGNASDPPCRRCRVDNQECFFSAPVNLIRSSAEAQQLVTANGQALPSLKDLACSHCNLVFLRDDDLRTHLRSQCTEKHYVCSTCHARFKRLNDLDRHNRIHTGERPHKCEICRRTFSRATTLSRHKQGPEGCAGRRADIGKRRLGSFQGPAPEVGFSGGDDSLSVDATTSEAMVATTSSSIPGDVTKTPSRVDYEHPISERASLPTASDDNVHVQQGRVDVGRRNAIIPSTIPMNLSNGDSIAAKMLSITSQMCDDDSHTTTTPTQVTRGTSAQDPIFRSSTTTVDVFVGKTSALSSTDGIDVKRDKSGRSQSGYVDEQMGQHGHGHALPPETPAPGS